MRWLLLALGLLSVACTTPRASSMRSGGVAIRRVTARERATETARTALIPGDYVLEGGGLRVVVGGLDREGDARGAILEATLEDASADDGIAQLSPLLYIGSDSHAVIPTQTYLVTRRGRPALRVEGEVRIEERVVRVEREMTIAPELPALSIATRVLIEGPALSQVRVGSQVKWGGASAFMPGPGELAGNAWHEGSYIGRSGLLGSAVIGFDRSPLRARAAFEQHGASDAFLGWTEIGGPAADIDSTAPLYARMVLVLSRGGLSDAVRRFGWTRGSPFPEALIDLPYVPEGTNVTVSTDAGSAIVEGRPPEGTHRLIVPLPPLVSGDAPRRLVATATAFGHAPSDAVPFEPDDDRVRVVIPEGGRIRVRARDASNGRFVPARVRILGRNGTRNPSLGPDYRADGAGDAVFTLEGEVIVPLQPGDYHVIVTHGPEWTLHEDDVSVTATYRPDVNASLSHVVDPGDWIASDFHLHAAPSPDSEVTLVDRIRTLVAEGVRFAVPTDHNHVTEYETSAAELGVRELATIPGVEVTTWDPNFGHFNAYPHPLDPSLPGNGAPAWLGVTPQALFEALHATDPDLIVQVNHPRLEGMIGYFDIVGLDTASGTASDLYSADFDAVEVWNGFDLARPEVFERVFADWLALLERRHYVVATGNSDSHKVVFQWAGYPRTYVRVPGGAIDDPRAILRALRRGHAFVTSGPFLEATVDGFGPGEVATIAVDLIEVRVVVRAPPWMDVSRVDVYAGDRLAASAPVAVVETRPRPRPPRAPARGAPEPTVARSIVRFDGVVPVDARGEDFIVVVARGDAPLDVLFDRRGILPIAFTNPIVLTRAPSDAGVNGAEDAGEDAGTDADVDGDVDAEVDAAADADADVVSP